MATPDPRRGDEPGEPFTPATGAREEDRQPAHDGVSPAVDEQADDPDAVSAADAPGREHKDEQG